MNGVFTRIHNLLSDILSLEEVVFVRLPIAFLGLFEYGWSAIQASIGPVSVTTWHLELLLCTTVLKLVSCLLELKMGQCRYVPTCFDCKTLLSGVLQIYFLFHVIKQISLLNVVSNERMGVTVICRAVQHDWIMLLVRRCLYLLFSVLFVINKQCI